MSETRRLTSVVTLRLGPAHNAFLQAAADELHTSSAAIVRAYVERAMREAADHLGDSALAEFEQRDEAGILGDDVTFAVRLASGVDVVTPEP